MLLFAEDDADGGVFVCTFHVAVEVVHIHLHLADVLVGEFADFEVKQDIASQQPGCRTRGPGKSGRRRR